MTSTEFIIDGVQYLLESDCEYRHWAVIHDRVVKYLERVGKETSKSMLFEATVLGTTSTNKELVSFKLTIHPSGNNFQ